MTERVLTKKQIDLIETNYRNMAQIPEQVADAFYTCLFEIAPRTKAVFHDTAMDVQGRKLMQIVGIVVGGLAQPDLLKPALLELGKRHVSYGVSNDMYAFVGQALLSTLADQLGADFTNEAKTAWTTLYLFLADVAISGADALKTNENA